MLNYHIECILYCTVIYICRVPIFFQIHSNVKKPVGGARGKG